MTLREGMKMRDDHKAKGAEIDTLAAKRVVKISGYHMNYGYAWGVIDLPLAFLDERLRYLMVLPDISRDSVDLPITLTTYLLESTGSGFGYVRLLC